MAIGFQPPTTQVSLKAIVDLDDTTDSIQIGGSVDGIFHGADATADNIKPFRFDDLGDSKFYPGVAIRGTDGVLLGTEAHPLVVSQAAAGLATFEGERAGKIMDETGVLRTLTTALFESDSWAEGNNAVFSAQPDLAFRVLQFCFTSSAAVNSQFVNPSLDAPKSVKVYACQRFDQSARPGSFLFESGLNQPVSINLSGACAGSLMIVYYLAPI